MGIQGMLQWWNLIYVLPLFTAIVWLLMSVLLGSFEGGDGGEVSAEAEADIGGDVEVDADLDADLVDGVHTPTSGNGHPFHVDLHHGESAFLKALMLFGMGKVPVTILIGIFMLSWGVIGLLANRIFGSIMVLPAIYIWPSLAVTFVVSSAATRTVAEVAGRFMPSTETYGVSRLELVGLLGKAVYAVSEKSGTVDIRDPYGTIHRVQAKTREDAVTIPASSQVMVIDFDESDKRYIVEVSTI